MLRKSSSSFGPGGNKTVLPMVAILVVFLSTGVTPVFAWIGELGMTAGGTGVPAAPSPAYPSSPAPRIEETAAVRIMPVGDSITKGSGSDPNLIGYRQELYELLLNAGYNVDFVGSQRHPAETYWPDQDHEGHGGWFADSGDGSLSVADHIYEWLQNNPADIVLLHVGTNDVLDGSQDPAKIDAILDEIDRYNPDVYVVLALIINQRTYSPETSKYNEEVKALAERRVEQGDRITVVDMEHALTYPDDISAGSDVHPNNSGYSKMAGVWFQALKPILDGNVVGVKLQPETVRVGIGDRIVYTAAAVDIWERTTDVTSQTSFSITSAAGGSWEGNVYLSQYPGQWTVTAVYNGKNGTGNAVVAVAKASVIAPNGVFIPFVLNFPR